VCVLDVNENIHIFENSFPKSLDIIEIMNIIDIVNENVIIGKEMIA
jgi:hypothetical protein